MIRVEIRVRIGAGARDGFRGRVNYWQVVLPGLPGMRAWHASAMCRKGRAR